jgi:zeaxanthin glucosyltransferase
VQDWVERESPSLLLFDDFSWAIGALACSVDVRLMALSPAMVSSFSLDHPPIHAYLVPREDHTSWRERARNLWAWATVEPSTHLGYALNPIFMLLTAELFVPFVQSGPGWRLGDLGTFRLKVPELVIGPRALDWPALAGNPSRHYLGTCVPPPTSSYDWSWYDPGKPLVYCAMGSIEPDFTPRKQFFRTVIEAFRHRTDRQLLVACLEGADELSSEPLPPHIRVERWVPQSEILERARLFIMQGGAASVRQAVHYGVPMLVFPMWSDHFGSAARVVYHRLGLKGDFSNATPAMVEQLVDELASRSDIFEALQKMKEQCRADDEMGRACDFIERSIGTSGDYSTAA